MNGSTIAGNLRIAHFIAIRSPDPELAEGEGSLLP
jgi:hypothetical protein